QEKNLLFSHGGSSRQAVGSLCSLSATATAPLWLDPVRPVRERGAPETASRRTDAEPRSSNSASASAIETAAASAADTLLFPVNALLHADRGARILAQNLAERGAGGFLLAQRSERLPEPQQRFGRLGGGLVF